MSTVAYFSYIAPSALPYPPSSFQVEIDSMYISWEVTFWLQVFGSMSRITKSQVGGTSRIIRSNQK